MLRSDLCDYGGAYVVVKERITVEGDNDAKTRNKKLFFKDNAPFRLYISKINNTFIDNAEDLDIVMLMYYLLEYSGNYSMTSGSLRNLFRDEVNDDENQNDNANNIINNNKTIASKYFEYQAKITGRIPADNNTLNAEVVIPLKYLSNFWRFFDLHLINCEIKLDLSWSKNCIISEISVILRIPANPDANLLVQEVEAIQTTGTTFQINNAKLYVPVVPLSINDDIKFLESI